MFSMFRIAAIANFLVRSFFIFLITYLWASYLIGTFFLTFLVAVLVTCVANYAWMYYVYRRRRSRNQTKVQIDHMNSCMLQFKFMTLATSLAFFSRVFEKKLSNEISDEHQSSLVNVARANSGFLSFQKDNKKYSFFPLFHIIPTKEEIIACINKTMPDEKCVIAAYEFDATLITFFKSLNVEVTFMNGQQIYDELLEPTKIFPTILIEVKKSVKLTFKRLGSLMFARKKVKSYIFVGIIILLTSLIIRPTLYYVIFATLIFGIALVSFLRPSISSKEKLW